MTFEHYSKTILTCFIKSCFLSRSSLYWRHQGFVLIKVHLLPWYPFCGVIGHIRKKYDISWNYDISWRVATTFQFSAFLFEFDISIWYLWNPFSHATAHNAKYWNKFLISPGNTSCPSTCGRTRWDNPTRDKWHRTPSSSPWRGCGFHLSRCCTKPCWQSPTWCKCHISGPDIWWEKKEGTTGFSEERTFLTFDLSWKRTSARPLSSKKSTWESALGC